MPPLAESDWLYGESAVPAVSRLGATVIVGAETVTLTVAADDVPDPLVAV